MWTGHFSSALEHHCLKTLVVIDPFQKLERKHFVGYCVKLKCFSFKQERREGLNLFFGTKLKKKKFGAHLACMHQD